MGEPAALPATPGPKTRFEPESSAIIALLTVLAAFGAISNNMVLPSLPALSGAFQVPAGVAMLAVSIFFLGFGVGQLFYGSLSDRFGRRPVLIGGLGLYTLASAACIGAPDIETLMATRLLQGVAAASCQVLARAIVRDHFTPIRAARVLSLMAAAFAFASALAPLAGGLAQAWVGWRGVFMVLTLIGAGTFLVVWLRFGESLAERDAAAMNPARLLENYRSLCRSRVFAGYTLAFATAFGGMFAFHSGSSFVLITLLGFGPEVFGLFFSFVIGGYFVGTLVSARLTVRLGIYRLVALGIVVCAGSGGLMLALVLAGPTSAAAILVPQFAFMFGIGLILPNAIAGAFGPFPDKAGAASALLGFTQQTGGGAMVVLLAVLVDGTAVPMAGCIFAGALLSLACFAVILPRPGGTPEYPR
jgi:DHA1 family bicyclomycin/chloramphenicol resistance-like MFS transporter